MTPFEQLKLTQGFVDRELLHQHHLVNWSNTHECHPRRLYEPETVEELEQIVAEAHEKGMLLPDGDLSLSLLPP